MNEGNNSDNEDFDFNQDFEVSKKEHSKPGLD